MAARAEAAAAIDLRGALAPYPATGFNLLNVGAETQALATNA